MLSIFYKQRPQIMFGINCVTKILDPTFFHTALRTYNFTHANKYSWQANKLLDIRAHLFCEDYTGTVHTTEERQLTAWKKKIRSSQLRLDAESSKLQ